MSKGESNWCTWRDKKKCSDVWCGLIEHEWCKSESEVWLRVLRDSDHWMIALQIADPSSRQRGRPTETRPQISDSNLPTGINICSKVKGCSIPRHTDWPTVSRKVTSNFEFSSVQSIGLTKAWGQWGATSFVGSLKPLPSNDDEDVTADRSVFHRKLRSVAMSLCKTVQ
jgi:hypothetical protein